MGTETIVTAKCIACGKTREIKAGEIAKNDTPMCPQCYMPMLSEKAYTAYAGTRKSNRNKP